MGKAVSAVLLAALLGAGCATGAPPSDGADFVSAPLMGMVYDGDNQPCAEVRIALDGVPGPVTDIRGRFLVADLAPGGHEVTAEKAGFERLSLRFAFRSRTDVLYLRMTSLAQLLSLAEGSLQDRRWEEARSLLSRAERLAPADPVLAYMKAVLAFRTGRHAEAAAGLEALLAAGVKDAPVYAFLADLYEGPLKEPAKARACLEACLAIRWDADMEKRRKALAEAKPAPAAPSVPSAPASGP